MFNIQTIKQFVNQVFRSKTFWLVIAGFLFLLWASKFDLPKVFKVIKLLAGWLVKIISLFLGLFAIHFKRIFKTVGLFEEEVRDDV